jgi:hypothetical protein
MKKFFAITAIAITIAGVTMTTASARNHRHHHGWVSFRGSNAELRGNYANSAGGRNSAVNSRNAGSRP